MKMEPCLIYSDRGCGSFLCLLAGRTGSLSVAPWACSQLCFHQGGPDLLSISSGKDARCQKSQQVQCSKERVSAMAMNDTLQSSVLLFS